MQKILCLFLSVLFVGSLFAEESNAQTEQRSSLHQDLFPSVSIPLYVNRVSQSNGEMFQNTPREKKSVALSVLYSLLLPGMGELYANDFNSGKYFVIAEATLWLTFTGFEMYGHWIQNDARHFTVTHAGVNPSGKDDQFFVNIGNFLNTYEYNEKKLRDRDIKSLYDVNSDYFWQWDSDASRQRYRDLRVKSDNVLNDVRFVVGAIIVNHLVSAINAARLTAKHNVGAGELEGWQIESSILRSFSKPDGVLLTLKKSF